MNIKVLTDKGGEIIGTARPGPFDGEVQMTIIPKDGQMVHDLDVPEELARLDLTELHKRLMGYLPKDRSRKKGA